MSPRDSNKENWFWFRRLLWSSISTSNCWLRRVWNQMILLLVTSVTTCYGNRRYLQRVMISPLFLLVYIEISLIDILWDLCVLRWFICRQLSWIRSFNNIYRLVFKSTFMKKVWIIQIGQSTMGKTWMWNNIPTL